MTSVTKPRRTFEAYLTYDDGTDTRYEWIDLFRLQSSCFLVSITKQSLVTSCLWHTNGFAA